MGLRLIGNTINNKKESEIITAGIPLGAIQIPGDGQPIISFVEHQTTGGYPIIANVITVKIKSQIDTRMSIFGVFVEIFMKSI